MKIKFTMALLCIVCSLPVQGKMYKWVDENGQMHFGDSIPMQYRVGKHMELNEKGALVKTHAAQETEEQRLEKKRIEELRKEEALRATEQEKKDRGLLDSYNSEQELIIARDTRIEAVDTQLKLSHSIIEDTQQKLEATQKQIAGINASGRQVPENLIAKLEHEKSLLASYEKVAAQHLEKKNKIHQQFNEYINRFRELKKPKG